MGLKEEKVILSKVEATDGERDVISLGSLKNAQNTNAGSRIYIWRPRTGIRD